MTDIEAQPAEPASGELVQSLETNEEKFGKILSPSSFVNSLPQPVQRRLRALKNLQKETFVNETKFFEELHQLEAKYERIFAPDLEKRYKIVAGMTEPTEDECNWSSDDDDGDEELSKQKTEKQAGGTDDNSNDVKGIPNFWLQIFKNVDILADMIQPCDEPILKHLIDVRVKTSTEQLPGYSLEFVFEPNEFFSNSVLTKDYILKFDIDPDSPLDYDGPEVIKCKGCVIDWKTGMDVTTKKVKKTQQHRNHGAKRTIIKTVPTDSFFNFFAPPEVAEGIEPDDETEETLSNDFEVGHFLRDQVIPKAVLFFTGDALEYDDDDDLSCHDDDSGNTDSMAGTTGIYIINEDDVCDADARQITVL